MLHDNMFWPLMKNTISFGDRLAMARFCLFSKRFTNGPKVREFEKAWSDWVEPSHSVKSVFVNSGGSANLLLLDTLKSYYGLKDGDKVLVPSITWSTNIAPIIQVGLEPVFCDVTEDFQWDLDYLNSNIELDTISVVFTTHLFGIYCSTKKLKELIPDALYIHDVCESHGVRDEQGVNVGALDQGATFSFYFGHHMTTVEGGMVSTTIPMFHDWMRVNRSHGLVREFDNEILKTEYTKLWPEVDPKFMFASLGYNLRNTEFGAALGLRQLGRLNSMINRRQQVYKSVVNILKTRPEIFTSSEYNMQSSFCIPVVCKTKEIKQRVERIFNSQGIETRPLCSGYLPLQPFLENMPQHYVPDTIAEDVASRGFFIGNNHLITNKDIDKLKGVIKNLW